MKFKLSFSYTIAFLSLLFVMHELHEIAHTVTGRIICGCWGLRDFNVWELCQGCSETHSFSVAATMAGPIFSFIMIWIGAYLLKNQSAEKKSWGFALVFTNMPFGRLLSALLDSGDEIFILKMYISNYNFAHIAGIVLILAIIFYPLLKAYQSIQNQGKTLWFLGFLMLPTGIDIVVVLGGMNTLLSHGFFDEYWILGSPKLVTYWSMFVLILWAVSYDGIFMNQKAK